MLTWSEELNIIINSIADAFKRQTNVNVKGSDFIYEFDIVEDPGKLALILNTKRTDDNLRIKAYLSPRNSTTVGKFSLSELTGYGPGPDDEVHVTQVFYDKRTLPALDIYIKNLVITVMDSLRLLATETGMVVITENDNLVAID
jgi:hypothetical protein